MYPHPVMLLKAGPGIPILVVSTICSSEPCPSSSSFFCFVNKQGWKPRRCASYSTKRSMTHSQYSVTSSNQEMLVPLKVRHVSLFYLSLGHLWGIAHLNLLSSLVRNVLRIGFESREHWQRQWLGHWPASGATVKAELTTHCYVIVFPLLQICLMTIRIASKKVRSNIESVGGIYGRSGKIYQN